MERNVLLISMVLISFLAGNCSTKTSPVYNFSGHSNPPEAGSVTPASGVYDKGEELLVTATPNEHWVFKEWQGSYSGTQNPLTFVIQSDMEITAMFIKRDYPLTITIEGEGEVTEEVVQEKTTDYPHGTVVKLTAEAETGWEFIRWEGDFEGDESNAELTLTILEGTHITAVFEKLNLPLTITIEGEGTVEQELVQGKTTEYPYGSVVRLTAKPAGVYEFIRWTGDLTGSVNPVDVTVDGGKTITAVFGEFHSGDGTAGNPYQVANLNQLNNVRLYPDAHFIQIADIDMDDTLQWNEGKGFDPIGDAGAGFSGSFDGNGYKILNFYINRGDIELQGLFGYVQEGGVLESIRMENLNVDHPEQTINAVKGSLAGVNEGLISNPSISGGRVYSSQGILGGIAGENYGVIKNCSVNTEIFGFFSNPGGVAGVNHEGAEIADCEVLQRVADSDEGAAGVVYLNRGTVERSYVETRVSGYRGSTGGLIALNYGLVSDSYAVIDNLYSRYYAGGLVGINYASGEVKDSFSSGNIRSGHPEGNGIAGGLIGVNHGSIVNSYSSTDVEILEHKGVAGGLIGVNHGEVRGCYSNGTVILWHLLDQGTVGALVGINSGTGEIVECYTVSENFHDDLYIEEDDDTYSPSVEYEGAFVGSNLGTVSAGYWDVSINQGVPGVGDGNSTGVTGLDTDEMTGASAEANMQGFDWINTWRTTSGYPVFRWQDD